jgi:putative transposase
MISVIKNTLPEVSTREVCRLLAINRARHYRHHKPSQIKPEDALVRQEIERIVLERARYGYRRVTHELKRRGQVVNHKKVLRLMRLEGLLCKPRSSFKPRTTNSKHDLRRYPNLVKKLIPQRPDHVWHADLTYIRLNDGFVYLACVLDGFSRKCVGWALSPFLDASVALEAVQMAITARKPVVGLIHHSDQGVQYASNRYIAVLEGVKAEISMSRVGNPYDNAKMESFMATVKLEEVHLNEYESYEEARGSIGKFIEDVYNAKRLHSSLAYLPPEEFEAAYARDHTG